MLSLEMMMKENTEQIQIFEKDNILKVQNNFIREKMPDILRILLIDRTTSTQKKIKNIIWANDNYVIYGGKAYAATSEIRLELVTSQVGEMIIPRALKSRELQRERTRSKAEVFPPPWLIKIQIDELEGEYKHEEIETYVKRKWLEVACGEAPYIATRYDMETGKLIPLNRRVGFLDRKLQRINYNIDDKGEWQRLVEWAYKSSYGFEWSGDSVLLARENLLYTYCDYYLEKWREEPELHLLEEIARVISFNIFQMDGLKYIIPLSDKTENVVQAQLPLFSDMELRQNVVIKPGKRVKVMNWESNKMEFFDKGREGVCLK